jgi:hypothetical protein
MTGRGGDSSQARLCEFLVHKLSIADFHHIHVDPDPTFHVDIDCLSS